MKAEEATARSDAISKKGDQVFKGNVGRDGRGVEEGKSESKFAHRLRDPSPQLLPLSLARFFNSPERTPTNFHINTGRDFFLFLGDNLVMSFNDRILEVSRRDHGL